MFMIYKITNRTNGRHFIGIHKTDDIYWANPRCLLSDLKSRRRGNLKYPGILRDDIKALGEQHFIIEAFQGAVNQDEADQQFDRIVTKDFRLRDDTYNRPLGRKKSV